MFIIYTRKHKLRLNLYRKALFIPSTPAAIFSVIHQLSKLEFITGNKIGVICHHRKTPGFTLCFEDNGNFPFQVLRFPHTMLLN